MSEEAGRLIRIDELWPDLPGAGGPLSSDQGLVPAGPSRRLEQIVLDLDLAGSPDGRLVCVSGADLAGVVQRWDPDVVPRKRHQGDGKWLDGGGEPILRHLEDDLPRLRSLDDNCGGSALLTLVDHQQRALAALASHYGEGTWQCRQAINVLAQYCQFAGWLALDLSQHARAQRYLFMAMDLSATVGNPELVRLAISCLGVQAIIRGRPQDARSLLTLATRGATGPHAGAAVFWIRRARASAAAGDATDCQRSLEEARIRVDAPRTDDDPTWSYWLTGTLLDAEEGRCWVDLDVPVRARRHLNRLVLAPSVSARDRVLYGAALAQAHLGAGDVDQACAELDDSSAHLASTSSRRCRELIDSVRGDLSGHRLPHVQRQGLARVALALQDEPDTAEV